MIIFATGLAKSQSSIRYTFEQLTNISPQYEQYIQMISANLKPLTYNESLTVSNDINMAFYNHEIVKLANRYLLFFDQYCESIKDTQCIIATFLNKLVDDDDQELRKILNMWFLHLECNYWYSTKPVLQQLTPAENSGAATSQSFKERYAREYAIALKEYNKKIHKHADDIKNIKRDIFKYEFNLYQYGNIKTILAQIANKIPNIKFDKCDIHTKIIYKSTDEMKLYSGRYYKFINYYLRKRNRIQSLSIPTMTDLFESDLKKQFAEDDATPMLKNKICSHIPETEFKIFENWHAFQCSPTFATDNIVNTRPYTIQYLDDYTCYCYITDQQCRSVVKTINIFWDVDNKIWRKFTKNETTTTCTNLYRGDFDNKYHDGSGNILIGCEFNRYINKETMKTVHTYSICDDNNRYTRIQYKIDTHNSNFIGIEGNDNNCAIHKYIVKSQIYKYLRLDLDERSNVINLKSRDVSDNAQLKSKIFRTYNYVVYDSSLNENPKYDINNTLISFNEQFIDAFRNAFMPLKKSELLFRLGNHNFDIYKDGEQYRLASYFSTSYIDTYSHTAIYTSEYSNTNLYIILAHEGTLICPVYNNTTTKLENEILIHFDTPCTPPVEIAFTSLNENRTCIFIELFPHG
jgi:hypothetical protein